MVKLKHLGISYQVSKHEAFYMSSVACVGLVGAQSLLILSHSEQVCSGSFTSFFCFIQLDSMSLKVFSSLNDYMIKQLIQLPIYPFQYVSSEAYLSISEVPGRYLAVV